MKKLFLPILVNATTRMSLGLWGTVFVFFLCVSGSVVAENEIDEDLEVKVKSGFLLNFIRLSTFSIAHPSFKICVEDYYKHRDTYLALENESVESIEFSLSAIPSGNAFSECQAFLFSVNSEVAQKIIALRPAGLMVGEGSDFVRLGGDIAMFREEGKFRFSVNMRSAEAAGIKFSSKLLGLAKEVIR